jgi:membrane protease YdiL (CAAX protease family)
MEEARHNHRQAVWRSFVAMLGAIALYFAATALAIIISSNLPAMDRDLASVAKVTVTIALTLAAYKFGIHRLSKSGNDDLPAKGMIMGLILGVLTGGALFAAIAGVAALMGIYRITSCCSTVNLVSDLATASIMPAFMEELFFRGILFRWIEEMSGSWMALVITAVLFGFAHALNPNATFFSSTAIAVEAGILLGGAYMLTRNLWLPIGLHAAWNFTQGYLFGIPVSGVAEKGLVTSRLSGPELVTGGGFGLEASVIALVIGTAAGVWLLRLAIAKGQLVQPSWVRVRHDSPAAR